jgi:hypothetical protein
MQGQQLRHRPKHQSIVSNRRTTHEGPAPINQLFLNAKTLPQCGMRTPLAAHGEGFFAVWQAGFPGFGHRYSHFSPIFKEYLTIFSKNSYNCKYGFQLAQFFFIPLKT